MSQVPATQADMQFASTGLEDFAVTDAVLPRIKIIQDEGMWADNSIGFKTPNLRFVIIGLVKQRVLFHHLVEDGDVPMCKSSNFNVGFPNPDAPQNKSFPWELSGFDPNDFPPDAEGNRQLPCDGCALKDWDSSPVSGAPYCSEQWTLPIRYDNGDGGWAPAILTLQKSNIKPIRTYLTSFAQSNKPPFTAICVGTLKVMQRGTVKYSIASFVKEGESDRSLWMEYSEQFGEMQTFLQRPPMRELEIVASDNTNQAPAQVAQQPVAAQPVPTQDPWVTTAQPVEPPPVQQQQPVVQQPVPPSPPAQPAQPVQPPAAQPVATPPPPAQPAAPVQAQPASVQAPAQPAAPAAPAGQELPF